jgi:hypothetical protein
MADRFNDELGSVFEPRGPSADESAVTIVLGLGEFGAACVSKIGANACASSDYRTLAILRAADIPAGISFQSSGGLTRISFASGQADRASVFKDFLNYSPSFATWLKSEVERLGRGAASGLGSGRIKILMIAKAEEIDGSALAAAVPPLVKSCLSGFIANWPVTVTGFFLLPKGRSLRGAQVYSLLRELKTNDLGYGHTFFVTEANIAGLIGEAGAEELLADFTDLMTESRFEAAVAEVLEVSGAVTAGFGLTCLVHPVDRLVAQESARFSREIIKQGLFSGAAGSFYRAADEYLKSEGFEMHSLRDRLVTDEEGDIPDRMTIENIELKGVPLSQWADRIASYTDYLGHERLPRLIGRIEVNQESLSRSSRAQLKATVDELMAEAGAVDKAIRFTDRLDEKAAELKEAVDARAGVDVDQGEDLVALRTHLIDRVKHFPEATAVFGRTLLLAPVVYYFFSRLALALQGLPDHYMNPAYAPPPIPTGLAALAVAVIFMWLLYRRAESGLARARDSYMRAIERLYRGVLNRAVWASLGEWLGETWPETIAAERRSLTDLKKEYLRVVNQLEPDSAEQADTGVSRSVLGVFGRQNDLRYKMGRYDLADEVERFAIPAHRHWRTVRSDELKRLLIEFCRGGLSFADQRSIDRLVVELISGEEQAVGLLEDLRRRSQPFTPLAVNQPAVVELAGVPGGRQSPLVSGTGIFKDATVVAVGSPHRLAFAQLVCPIEVENLAAFSQWRRDYENYADTSCLDCRHEEGGEAL